MKRFGFPCISLKRSLLSVLFFQLPNDYHWIFQNHVNFSHTDPIAFQLALSALATNLISAK